MSYIKSHKTRSNDEEAPFKFDLQILTEDHINSDKRIIHFYGDVDDKLGAPLCKNLLIMDEARGHLQRCSPVVVAAM